MYSPMQVDHRILTSENQEKRQRLYLSIIQNLKLNKTDVGASGLGGGESACVIEFCLVGSLDARADTGSKQSVLLGYILTKNMWFSRRFFGNDVWKLILYIIFTKIKGCSGGSKIHINKKYGRLILK